MRALLVSLGLVSLILSGFPFVLPHANSTLSANQQSQTAISNHLQAKTDCAVTRPVAERPPDDPHASSFAGPGTWYANSERTMWAWWWGKRSAGDYKILWVRPAGAQLKITGRRLDAEARELKAEIPHGYRHTFQASAVAFPSDGCWEVEATAGDARITFVVRIP